MATLELNGSAEQPIETLHVRATEYTAGTYKLATMPGALPSNSGYTYAAEFGVDEAVAAGAREVRFSQPVIAYLENVLNFPIGESVPAGYYDRERAAWIASDSGQIVGIVDVTDGRANLDLDGDGAADDPTTLDIGDAERAMLAGRYEAGQTLWRVPIPHFSAWDFNW